MVIDPSAGRAGLAGQPVSIGHLMRREHIQLRFGGRRKIRFGMDPRTRHLPQTPNAAAVGADVAAMVGPHLLEGFCSHPGATFSPAGSNVRVWDRGQSLAMARRSTSFSFINETLAAMGLNPVRYGDTSRCCVPAARGRERLSGLSNRSPATRHWTQRYGVKPSSFFDRQRDGDAAGWVGPIELYQIGTRWPR
jgi:hypothetical protein